MRMPLSGDHRFRSSTHLTCMKAVSVIDSFEAMLHVYTKACPKS